MGVVQFVQLARPFKTLELGGNAAPHGRARASTIVTPEQRLRESEVYLPGSDEPVVHIFGQRREPLKFKGRFRDRGNGVPGFALAKHQECKSFFSDQVPCRVTWEDVIGIHGLITGYKADIEARHEIAYEFEIKVLRDLFNPTPKPLTTIKGPKEITDQIVASLALKDALPYTPPTLKGSIVDVLNSLVGDINSASASLLAATDDIDSFVTGTFTALRRFHAGLGQVAVAVKALRGTYDNLLNTAALENEDATQSQQFWDIQAAWASSTTETLRLIAQAERESAKAERGTALALHEAGEGETWQSIAIRWYGSADRAQDIRQANGMDVGVEPTPGVIYLVPR